MKRHKGVNNCGGGLSVTPSGVIFEYINQDEADFLYEEIFEQNVYLCDKSGIEVKDGDHIFDIGANIGLFSLSLLSKWQNLKIVAVEPIMGTFQVLKRNLSSYAKHNTLTFLRFGVGANCNENGLFYCFRNMPGESTRYLDERNSQRKTLKEALLISEIDDKNNYDDKDGD